MTGPSGTVGAVEELFEVAAWFKQAMNLSPKGDPAVLDVLPPPVGPRTSRTSPPPHPWERAYQEGWYDRLGEEVGTEEDPNESWRQKMEAFGIWPKVSAEDGSP